MNTVDLITILIFLGALACVASVVLVINSSATRRNKKRVDTLQRRWSGTALQKGSTDSLLRDTSETRMGSLALRLMPRREMLRQRLMKAGVSTSPGQYALISVIVGLVVGTLAEFVFGASVMISVLIAIVFGVGGPHKYLSMLAQRRLTKFTKIFPEAIDQMVRGIRSGLPITETLNSIGQEMVDPVGTEFRRVTDSIRLGQTLEEALWDVAQRLDTADFKFFVISLSVQRETGGNLAETLENLSDILRRRQQMLLKIKAMSSEARASAYIIGSLPFIMFGILLLMNPAYIMVLFTDPRGMMIIGAGLLLMLMGCMVMAKMVKFEI